MQNFEMPLIRASRDDLKALAGRLGMRRKMDLEPVLVATQKILTAVRQKGDAAVLEFTREFDGAKLDSKSMRVSTAEMKRAMEQVDPDLKKALTQAARNIFTFHEKQLAQDTKHTSENGSQVWLQNRPLEVVGVYVPGGTAPLPSSVLMNVLPAKAAGVGRVVMCTPPRRDGQIDAAILVAAHIAGASEVYKVGGAQAIAAMASGTETIPAVDKIVGPGNIYVNTAKRLVYGQVDIDMFAGPSEILVVADDSANPDHVSADLLSQAEHDRLASAILITDSAELASRVQTSVQQKAARLPRREIIAASLADYGAIVLVDDLDEGIEFANELAPEHLELLVRNAKAMLGKVRHAGAVFLGPYSPEALGDYWAGANHVLPTSGTARFFSPLHTNQFIKKMSVIEYTQADLEQAWPSISTLAEAESLEAHADSVRVRFDAGKY